MCQNNICAPSTHSSCHTRPDTTVLPHPIPSKTLPMKHLFMPMVAQAERPDAVSCNHEKRPFSSPTPVTGVPRWLSGLGTSLLEKCVCRVGAGAGDMTLSFFLETSLKHGHPYAIIIVSSPSSMFDNDEADQI